MKVVKYLVVMFLLISLCGCVVGFRNVNREILGGVAAGMSQEEVKGIAGDPAGVKDLIVDGREYEVWSYPIEDKLAGKYNALGYPYYEVLFSDGKVRRWHKSRVYSQPEYELEHYNAPEDATTVIIFDKN